MLAERDVRAADAAGAALLYGATGDAAADARVAEIGRAAGVLVNLVDNLEDSDFITPAIVDRDPVTVAIGTEGAAPVLARKIKAEVEAMLPATLGRLTRIGQGFRARVEALDGKARRVVLDPVLLRARAAGAGGRRGGGARGARADARRGRGPGARVRASGRHRPGRPGAADAEGAAAAARGGRRGARPAGAAGDPRARPARGGDRRGRQDPPTASRGSRTTSTRSWCGTRPPARRWCG